MVGNTLCKYKQIKLIIYLYLFINSTQLRLTAGEGACEYGLSVEYFIPFSVLRPMIETCCYRHCRKQNIAGNHPFRQLQTVGTSL